MEVATLIGDVVGSRAHADRRVLHEQVRQVLGRANQLLRPQQALEVTVGDEFQGCFAGVPEAARASLLIRLMLLENGSDSRYGLGWGTVTVLDAGRTPISQDGPGWWAARAAIERTAKLAKSSRTSFARTSLSEWDDEEERSRVKSRDVV